MEFESELNDTYLLHLEPEVTSASYLLRNDTKISDLPDQSWFFRGEQNVHIIPRADHIDLYLIVESRHPRTVIDHFAAKRNTEYLTIEATLHREGENLVDVSAEISNERYTPVYLMTVILNLMEDANVVAD